MFENNLIKKKKRKYKSFRGQKNTNIDNVLNRNFNTKSPYQKLGTDITYFVIPKGKLYLSPIIDFHTREVLAYDLSRKPNFNQIKRMMNNLKLTHGDKIKDSHMQSDQGWQYQMKWYQLELEKLGIEQSMSRRGNCLDNSQTENFFGRMKVEMFNNRTFESLEHLEDEIHKYLKYYNEERIVTKLKTNPLTYRARFYNHTNT